MDSPNKKFREWYEAQNDTTRADLWYQLKDFPQAREALMKIAFQGLNTSPVFARASGDCVCPTCSKPYRKHPHDKAALSFDYLPFLRVLCNGDRVKL